VIWLDSWDIYAYTEPDLADLSVRIEGKIEGRILASMWEHAPSLSRDAKYPAIVTGISQREDDEEARIVMTVRGTDEALPLEVVHYAQIPHTFVEGGEYTIQVRLPAGIDQVSHQDYLDAMTKAMPETVLEIYAQYRKLRKAKVFQIINTELENKVMSLGVIGSFLRLKEDGSGYETEIKVGEDTYPAFLPRSLSKTYGYTIQGHAYLTVKEWDHKSEQAILELAPPEYVWGRMQKFVGTKQNGTINSIKEGLGVFVHITSGITGLVHSKYRAPDNLQPGDKVKIFIKSIDSDKGEVELRLVSPELQSLKTSLPPTFITTAKSKVRGGLLIDFPGSVRAGVNGFVPFSLCNGFIEEGDRILVMLESWDEYEENFVFKPVDESGTWDYLSRNVNKLFEGGVVKGTKDGLGIFVHLINGVQGLVHISQLPSGRTPQSYQKVNSLAVRIYSVDKDQKRISLNLR
jgi:predicted RNA-binding protein with RPS1 domain